MTAELAVEQQPRLIALVPLEPRHAQGNNEDVSRHIVAQLQAYHLATEQVDHQRK
jgi:hypothetical protein